MKQYCVFDGTNSFFKTYEEAKQYYDYLAKLGERVILLKYVPGELGEILETTLD